MWPSTEKLNLGTTGLLLNQNNIHNVQNQVSLQPFLLCSTAVSTIGTLLFSKLHASIIAYAKKSFSMMTTELACLL